MLSKLRRLFQPDWPTRVGRVFTTSPRIRGRNTIWLSRVAEEAEFVRSLQLPGLHLVVDGSSGTGKSSLVLSDLVERRQEFATVQVTSTMRWSDVCREIVRQQSPNERTRNTRFEMGVDRALPTAKLQVSLAETASGGSHESLSEHDIARAMSRRNVPLFVDDFDQACDDVVQRLANLAKLLTQSYDSPSAKLIIVGTGDVLRRILAMHPALADRLAHISLGTFGTVDHSWSFLTDGLDRLGIRHPGHARELTEQALLAKCRRAVFAAADGLPKSLNKLGQRLCLGGEQQKAISARSFIEAAEQMPTEFILRHAESFPGIVALLVENEAALEALTVLYERGIGEVHLVSVIVSTIARRYSSGEVDDALDALINVGFLTRTGVAGERIFTNNPDIAHNLGVLLSSPDRFDIIKDLYDPQTVAKLEAVFSRALFASRDLPPLSH